MNFLHWLLPYKNLTLSDISSSKFASIRLRVFPCVNKIQREGFTFFAGESGYTSCKNLIIGKIGSSNLEQRCANWLRYIDFQRSCGSRIFLDYTDHHLGFDSPMKLFYLNVLKNVDCCIVPSPQMAVLLSSFYNGPISIIEDLSEFSFQSPKSKLITNPPTAFWFGHSTNIEFLIDFINSTNFLMTGCNLIVLSNESGLNFFQSSNFNCLNPRQLKLALWSVDTMLEAARLSDFCIIPSSLSNPSKIGASSNRLITSFALGLPTAADYLPSYQEFSDYFVDIRSSFFNNLLTNPLDFSDKVISAQTSIVNRFSVEKISNDWLKLLSPIQ